MIEKTTITEIDMRDLWLQYRQTNDINLKEKLIEYYLPLVKIVAGRIAIGLPQHVDKDDLVNNGFFGLLNAIERFDVERGVKFETYAATRIRGSILDAIRAQDWIPTSLRQKAKAFEEVVVKLEATNALGDGHVTTAKLILSTAAGGCMFVVVELSFLQCTNKRHVLPPKLGN